MLTESECVTNSEHKWEYFVADEGKGISGGTPYYFCELCKKTWFNGRIYGFKS
jgi:hypothetical protein